MGLFGLPVTPLDVLGVLVYLAWSPCALLLLVLTHALALPLYAYEALLRAATFKKSKVQPGDGYALVTGASSGIGEYLALDLAARGFDLVLVARRLDRLESLAAKCKAADAGSRKRGIDVRTVQCDLSQPAQLGALVSQLEPLPLAVLVNNAGFSEHGTFLEKSLPRLEAINAVNVHAPLALTHGLVPQMARAGRGHVLNVASISSFVPGPREAVYHATKAYILSLSRSLNYELRASGVSVTALCPGPVRTEFFEQAAAKKTLLAFNRPMWESAADVAKLALDATFARTAVVMPNLPTRWLLGTVPYFAPSLFCTWLFELNWREYD